MIEALAVNTAAADAAPLRVAEAYAYANDAYELIAAGLIQRSFSRLNASGKRKK